MTKLFFLGHAGFIVQDPRVHILIDPWFFPAFAESWFPFPDNRFLLDRVVGQRFNYLYVSHIHEDHLDRRVLQLLDQSVKVLCPRFRSRALVRRLRALGLHNLIELKHRESFTLADNVVATMYLDTSHKEDSGLLLDIDGVRFLDLNDCNARLAELPQDIDFLAAQFSGAMWYPHCYDYPPDVLKKKVRQVRSDLMDTLIRKCQVTRVRWYLPSAGPACLLDPALRAYNDRQNTIFPLWEDVASQFIAACPETGVVRLWPGDRLQLRRDRPLVLPYSGQRPSDDVTAYAKRRRGEWKVYYTEDEPSISTTDLYAYFARLQRANKHLLHNYGKLIRLVAGSRMWGVRLGQLGEDSLIEGDDSFPSEYTFMVPPRLLRRVLDGEFGWEEALLSMRIRLYRDPDLFDSKLMGLLRYGNEPAQTVQMVRESRCGEMIERDGMCMQRYCPHAGEDLNLATVNNGIIECPRHHWKWDIATGVCIEGGSIPLRVERILSNN